MRPLDRGNGSIGFVVTWQSETGGVPNVFAQRLDAALDRVGSEIKVTAHSDKRQIDARVVKLADGKFVVAWAEDTAGALDIMAQRYDGSTGDPSGAAIVVNTRTANVQRQQTRYAVRASR